MDPHLAEHAQLLAEELELVHGLKLKIGSPPCHGHDIRLSMDEVVGLSHEKGAYSISTRSTTQADLSGIRHQFRINAYDALGMAHATATFLQLVEQNEAGGYSVMGATIHDEPAYEFRSVMLDLGRQSHTVRDIEHVIALCRLYKVPFLHLHLSDDAGWMFPSKAFPELGRIEHCHPYKGDAFAAFSLEEWKGLVEFADRRGVTLIPEIDLPGHSSAMRRAAPEAFDPAGIGVVNVATESVYNAIETLFGELAEVFASSPYIHFGMDEVNLDKAFEVYKDDAWVTERGISSGGELFNAFQEEMVGIIERTGKQPMAWEGHRPKEPNETLRKIIWLNWSYGSYPMADMLDDGYQVINATFAPLYVIEGGVDSTPEDVFDWHMGLSGNYPGLPRRMDEVTFRETPDPERLLGATMCSWENPGWYEMHALRQKLPIFSQRTWAPDSTWTLDEVQERTAQVDEILERLLPDLAETQPAWDWGQPEGVAKVYEGFASPSPFYARQQWPWKSLRGSGSSEPFPDDMQYTDRSGHKLQTQSGAVIVSSNKGRNVFGREIKKPLPIDEGYWVSFLIRRIGEKGGAGYWTPHPDHYHGGFGFERTTTLRNIRGGLVGPAVEDGATHFVVLNLRNDLVARVWLDPDLKNPAPPQLVGLKKRPIDLAFIAFAANDQNGNTYFFDEFRAGLGFRAVAPIAEESKEPR